MHALLEHKETDDNEYKKSSTAKVTKMHTCKRGWSNALITKGLKDEQQTQSIGTCLCIRTMQT